MAAVNLTAAASLLERMGDSGYDSSNPKTKLAFKILACFGSSTPRSAICFSVECGECRAARS